MIDTLTTDQALTILSARLERGWLETLQSTPEGAATLAMLVTMACRMDAKNADDAASLYVRLHSRRIAPPASGPKKATTTLAITLRVKPREPFTLPAGVQVQTHDGHIFTTDEALSFAPGDVGVPKTVGATALVAGPLWFIPPQEITQFTKVANGISGVGTTIELVTVAGSQKALRLRTDTTQPHPFKSALLGMYAEIVSTTTLGAASNVGRRLALVAMNNMVPGSPPTEPVPSTPADTEDEFAWGATVDISVDARYAPWITGAQDFIWRILDWDEMGLSVTNTTWAEGGRRGLLDEFAQARGRPRLPGEEDEQLRARLMRKPEPPSPLGLLRKCIVAVQPWAITRSDLRIYEMGQAAPSSVDPYSSAFPASLGAISNIHCTDMPTPLTTDGMMVDANNTPLGIPNTGLALVKPGTPWVVIVRWDAPTGMSDDTAATIRRLLYAAATAAVQPGCLLQLFEPGQWGFP